jgi:hypothetical protein
MPQDDAFFNNPAFEVAKNRLLQNSRTDSHRSRLLAFYERHNPTKVDQIDYLLQKWAGREHELFANLEQK